MNKEKWFLLVIILAMLSVSVPIVAAGSPDAREVLRRFAKPDQMTVQEKRAKALKLVDKYTQALDSTSSFIEDYEKTTEGSIRSSRGSNTGKYFSREFFLTL